MIRGLHPSPSALERKRPRIGKKVSGVEKGLPRRREGREKLEKGGCLGENCGAK